MSTIEQRVAAGAAFLDEHAAPDWRQRIDPEMICMESAYRCVLGQAFAAEGQQHAEQEGDGDDDGYTYGCGLAARAIRKVGTPDYPAHHWARDHAFSGEGDDDWAALRLAWIDRLTADALPVA